MGPYADCGACLDGDFTSNAGAKGHECKAEWMACMADPDCKAIWDCVYDPANGCTTDAAGACCTYACYKTLSSSDTTIKAYEALDQCTTCKTCKALCDMAQQYCDAYAMGSAGCP
jgi:hypothetical protein